MHLPKYIISFTGVTSNLISRIEVWNDGRLVEARELGFMKKMTRGARQELSVEFYGQDNEKYNFSSIIEDVHNGFLKDFAANRFATLEYSI
ncbi:MAG: hypothetical protein J5I94_00760 [Phaeodactylibacter sp.]|nr:hypothetical protein [Phaeodactylibacter sp.]